MFSINNFVILFICAQVGLFQNVYSQYIGQPGPLSNAHGLGYPGIGIGPGIAPGIAPGIRSSIGLDMAPGYPAAAIEVPVAPGYSGTGVGDVAVAGEMPVAGTTLVAGQVPILGAVRFAGELPAAGTVSIAGSCGCGAPHYY